jgi:hypothetical protein
MTIYTVNVDMKINGPLRRARHIFVHNKPCYGVYKVLKLLSLRLFYESKN